MDSIFALQGENYVIMACDCTCAYSIMKFKETQDKILLLDDDKLFGIAGEEGDKEQFSEYMQKNVSLYRYRNGQKLTTTEAANFIRSELAQAIRKAPQMCNALVAGYDKKDCGPALYWIDYLGTLIKTNKAAQGYAGYFLLGLLDNFYKPNLNEQDGINIMKYCINELKTRFLLSQNKFIIKIVNEEGIKTIPMEMLE